MPRLRGFEEVRDRRGQGRGVWESRRQFTALFQESESGEARGWRKPVGVEPFGGPQGHKLLIPKDP